MKYTCPCCGHKTLHEKPPGTYEICGLCGWEDDSFQFREPDYEGGANGESLRQAQHNFLNEFKLDQNSYGYVKDENWVILSPPKEKIRRSNVKANFVVDSKGIVTKKNGGS